MDSQRVRFRFRKEGDLRYIGHRDLLRTLERLFRRAGLKMRMSEGFHPKPRFSFPSALAVGLVGTEEMMELELDEPLSTDEILLALRPQCPPGLEFLSAEVIPAGTKKAKVTGVTYTMLIPADRQEDLRGRIDRFLAQPTCLVDRPKRSTPLDIRPLVEALVLEEGNLSMQLRTPGDGSPRPREVLAALGIDDLESAGFQIARTEVQLETTPTHSSDRNRST